ncbi:F0F1 ATP synthase subunit gamma [Kaustia mangrovi]|uniref:F0F1 ATP synthase subunit gamma n=1 Tax=Kaustia mangrovi TaxID=2593653 RepID=A0A7S8HAT9_9HYPH|nr:F0F1 ATP synthase subunit gamma [Kaustia mangrovi]QPC41937.1 F0F1 ATP synthase subunit gamma [Kaustia mangrovi]
MAEALPEDRTDPAKAGRVVAAHGSVVDLHERRIGEYLFALMTEAAIESIASETAARFATMSAAHETVSDKVDELRQEARQARQSEIATELLDPVTGADAQLGDSR